MFQEFRENIWGNFSNSLTVQFNAIRVVQQQRRAEAELQT